MLDKFCCRSKRKRSEVVRDALRRQLSLMTFEQLRHKAMPFAEAHGSLTDEDLFKAVLRGSFSIPMFSSTGLRRAGSVPMSFGSSSHSTSSSQQTLF